MDTVAPRDMSLKKPSLLRHLYAPGIRTSLAVLVVGCVLPIAVVAAFLMLRFYETEQVQLTTRAIGRARAIVTSLDRDFGRTEASLQALATSHRLVNDDLAGFYLRAVEALRNMEADSIAVVDLNGQLLLSTRRPFGTPLPKWNNTPLLARVLKSGEPAVSDLYLGPIIERLIFTIAVPVKVNGATVSLLNANATPAQIAGLLGDHGLPDNWHATIVDGTGKMAARNKDTEKVVGKQISPDLLQRMSRASEAAYESGNTDGIPVVTAYSRSSRTGWSAVVEIPLNELTAGLRHTLSLLIGATMAALGFGLALAWLIGGADCRFHHRADQAGNGAGNRRAAGFSAAAFQGGQRGEPGIAGCLQRLAPVQLRCASRYPDGAAKPHIVPDCCVSTNSTVRAQPI